VIFLIICPSEFETEDSEHKGYSMAEVDYYSWIPSPFQTVRIPNHRLSLRKNLVSGQYEVYRKYYETPQSLVVRGKDFTMVTTGKESLDEEVVFKGSLEEAIRFADNEWHRYHGEGKERDEVCQHKYLRRSLGCNVQPEESKVREEDQELQELWKELGCVKACWFAKGEKCVCRCGGVHHGKGSGKRLEQFQGE